MVFSLVRGHRTPLTKKTDCRSNSRRPTTGLSMWPVTDGEEAWCVVQGPGIAGPTSTSSRRDKPPGREHSEATGHHRPLGSVCAQPRHCRSSASPVPLRCCHRSAGSASKARRPAGDGLASNACPDGAPGPAEVIQIGVQVEVPVCGEWLFPSKLGRCLTRSRRTAGNQRADSRGMLTLMGVVSIRCRRRSRSSPPHPCA